MHSRAPVTLIGTFYVLVVVVALVGAAQAATVWLGWPLPASLGAVACLELGGVVLAHHATTRRMLGEAAVPARIVSAIVAAGATAANIAGHRDRPLQAVFFGSLSALGYGVWIIVSESRRRDALRAAGLLVGVAPTYGAWRWITRPCTTRTARDLARRHGMSAWDAWDEARSQTIRRARRASIARVLRRKIRSAVDASTASIAINVYDMDAVAERLSAGADYDALTRLISDDLAPVRLAGSDSALPQVSAPDRTSPISTPATVFGGSDDAPQDAPDPAQSPTKNLPAPVRIQRIKATRPDATQFDVAVAAGLSLRTVQRHWGTNGHRITEV